MTASGSAKRSNVARKYSGNPTRGLRGGKAGQVLAPLRIRIKQPPTPPRIKIPPPPPNPEKARRRLARRPDRPPPTCQYKRSFESWLEAERQILATLAYVSLPLKAYRCRRCGDWHARKGRRNGSLAYTA